MNLTRRVRDRARAPSRSGRLQAEARFAAIAATGALLLAGCGGSSLSASTAGGGNTPTSSTAAGGDTSAGASPISRNARANGVKFARCIRSHGVPDFPDPSSSGKLTIPPDDRGTPAFESAQKACQSILPGGTGGAGQTSTLSRAQELQLAKCMRSHGVPNFPDPNASGGLSLTGINPNSPALKAALQACQPAGGPSLAP
jgi:hypothetical protein